MSAIPTIAGYALREALRRKVFAVVLLLTAGFLFLYWLANHYLFADVNSLGSPESGLTNQQNWDRYRIAIAGSVAPSNTTTITGIDGLIRRI